MKQTATKNVRKIKTIQKRNELKYKQTHKSPTTIKLSRGLQNNTQSWNITPPALGSLLDQLASPARPGRQRISPAGGSAKKGDPPRGSRRQLGLTTHAFISTLQAMFKKSSPGRGFPAEPYSKHCAAGWASEAGPLGSRDAGIMELCPESVMNKLAFRGRPWAIYWHEIRQTPPGGARRLCAFDPWVKNWSVSCCPLLFQALRVNRIF